MSLFDLDPESLRYDDRGLVACIAQEIGSGAVLMLAWADREAVARTLESGEAHFWSRSRQEPWHKGVTSGNVLAVREIRVDCDRDALLLRVEATGPACHRGSRSCFEPNAAALELGWLAEVIAGRRGSAPEESYTARLLEAGLARVAQKVGEEAVEVVIAALEGGESDPLPAEAADLLYHLLVLLEARGVAPEAVARALRERHTPTSGDPR